MLIVHERLPEEALAIAKVIKSIYSIESVIEERDLEGVFSPIKEFEGYFYSPAFLLSALNKFRSKEGRKNGKATLVLTNRDLYLGSNKDDDWIFGYNSSNISVVSTARIRREDNLPSDVLQINKDLYLNRLSVLGVHEIGHDVVGGNHMQLAYWINAKNGNELGLGPHCTDNTCVMYEVIDIKTPSATEGYMRLGTENRFDAGLDEHIQRLRPDYLCGNCRSSTNIGENYE